MTNSGDDPKTLLLVDFSALFWLHWHATADAELSQARDLTVAMIDAESKHHDYTAICVDSRTSFRRTAFPDYKANREAKPRQALEQMLRTIEALRGLGFHLFGAESFEGDDIIATFVDWAGNDYVVTMFGCDKDLYQLLAPNVCLLNHRTGKPLDLPGLKEKLGIEPRQIPDWLALMGDKADNLPGVRLVGEVKASGLIQRWGDLEGIYDRLKNHATDFKPALSTALRDAEARIYQVRELATLNRAAPIDCAAVLAKTERADVKPSQFWQRLADEQPVPGTTAVFDLDAMIRESPASTTSERTEEENEPMVQQQPKSQPRPENGKARTSAPSSPASALSLASVTRGTIERPRWVLIYGVPGIGKSSFAADAPSPLFLDTDDGTAELDVARLAITSWGQILSTAEELRTGAHDYKTVVLDTIDAAEPMCWAAVCGERKKKIEDFAFDDYSAAVAKWQDLCRRLRALRDERGMNVVMVAHSLIKKYSNPEGDDFDRYQMKIHEKSAAVLHAQVDAVLFAQYETFTNKEKRKVIGVDSGERVLRTERRAAFDAKNRYNLPDTIPLSAAAPWRTFEDAIAAAQFPVDESMARIEALLGRAPEELQAAVRNTVEKANGDPRQLARIAEKLAAKLEVAA